MVAQNHDGRAHERASSLPNRKITKPRENPRAQNKPGDFLLLIK
jgi:hypothetical protein